MQRNLPLRLRIAAVIVLTAFSRMLEGMHYASDVTAGAMIALLWWLAAAQRMAKT